MLALVVVTYRQQISLTITRLRNPLYAIWCVIRLQEVSSGLICQQKHAMALYCQIAINHHLTGPKYEQ
ncbi:hypothetical protein DPMN_125566 [Dreissena polymorpha]|uniref:Uncharacterized protein n=1 Tax=Dreissena polymorpha TaxID=45954 RepID=A0A9D4JX73_DREPO|nr:hypothetical protein DPMN_125566 [Dreissena polymorpha]